MATINTTEELLELLREDTEFREAVRREVLTEDITGLPGEVTSITERGESTQQIIKEMVEIQNRTVQHLADLQQTQIGILETQNTILETQTRMLDRLNNIETRVERMDGAFGNFRGNYAEAAAIKNAASIAFGLDEVKDIGLDETRIAILTRETVQRWPGSGKSLHPTPN